MPRSISVVFLLTFLLVWSWCFWLLKFPYIGDIWDDGNYVVSARALREGHGYMLPSRPGPPARPKYPIGFPAVLAIFGGGESDRNAFAVEVAAAWVLAFGLYVWLRRLEWDRFPAALAAVAAIFASLPRNRQVMADLPLCAVAAILFARWQRPGSKRASFADGMLVAFAFLLRRPGIALLPAALLGRRGGTSKAAVIAGFLLVDLPLEWYAARMPNAITEVYLSEAIRAGWGSLSGIAEVLARNLKALAFAIPETAAPFLYSSAVRAFSGVVVAAVTLAVWTLLFRGVRGLGTKWRSALTPVWIFCGLTVGIIAVWPWPVGARLGMPLAPAAVLALGCGAASFRSRGAAMAVWAVLLAGNLALTARGIRVARSDARPGGLAQTFDFIRRNTPADAVLISEAPEMMYLYTGRQGVPMMDMVEWDHPGRIGSLNAWLPRAGKRPLFAIGACVPTPDQVTEQTRALFADPAFTARELFRTADCRYTISTIVVRKPESD